MIDYEELILKRQEEYDGECCGMADDYDYAISEWLIRKLETNLCSEKGELGWHVQPFFWKQNVIYQTAKAMLVRLDHYYRMDVYDDPERDEIREIWIPKSCIYGVQYERS